MNAPTTRFLIAGETATIRNAVSEALATRGLPVEAASYAHATALLDGEGSGPLVVIPTLRNDDRGDAWSGIAAELTHILELIQHYVRRAIAQRSGGHVVALLPAGAAMGDALDTPASALSGGMLSLFRTLALELRKLDMTVNTILYEVGDDGIAYTAEVAALLATFAAQANGAITGQEIYACNGNDAGRLHP
jgi:NAD(P)-dependent dehydrogenase (short-subunit alcohol dehydrogenase family)